MLVGSPWKAMLTSAGSTEIRNWVRAGGRLVLMGFELGDRHHEANLNELAELFGIHFNTDIVAPAGWNSDGKPYGIPVAFSVDSSAHPLLKGIAKLQLINTATLTVEPGSLVLVRTGQNRIGWLRNAKYQDEKLIVGEQRFDFSVVPMTPVVAMAAPGLAGKGEVIGIGTWDVLGLKDSTASEMQAQRQFVRNMILWLARRSE